MSKTQQQNNNNNNHQAVFDFASIKNKSSSSESQVGAISNINFENNSSSNFAKMASSSSTSSCCCSDCSCSSCDCTPKNSNSPNHHQSNTSNHSDAAASRYLHFTQEISGPTFVPVFNSVQDILPHHNSSAKGQVPWKCARCPEIDAFGHKCPNCGRSRDTSALRVFMGQLSKEGDVELITKMLEVLCPDSFSTTSNLLHIEPHTHAGSGRGKGCAWVYVSSLQDVFYLVQRLHKRTYPTVNAQTGEVGFVAFPDSYSELDIKAAFDNDVQFLSASTLALFHRSPITCEVPLTLQRSLEMNNTTTNNSSMNNFAAPAPSYHQQQVPAAPPMMMMMQQQQQQQPQVQVQAPSSQQQHSHAKLSKLPPKAFVFRSFIDVSPKTDSTTALNSHRPQFPAIVEEEIVNNNNSDEEENNNNNGSQEQQQQGYLIVGAAPIAESIRFGGNNHNFKRYRWNPYSNSANNNRVGVHN